MKPSPSRARVGSSVVVEGLRKQYGRRIVVDDVALTFRTGEVVGLLGPNGAGKTTTFYMIVGLVRPDEGHITLRTSPTEVADITALPIELRARLGIGYLAQENSVFRKLTVADNLRLVWEMYGLSQAEQERRLPAMLADFGLTERSNALAETLSGGERRRVEIARSLATDPAFLLLDEPFTGIDPIAVADIQQMIRRLRDRGIGILITDHQVRETLAIVDRAYLLTDGRIGVAGTPEEILADTLARQRYLGEHFRL